MVRAVLHKEIVTGATYSAVGVLKDPPVLNWKETGGNIPRDRNTVRIPPRATTQVWTGIGPSAPPIRIGSQKIEVPRRTIITQEARNSEPLDASINIIPAKHRDPKPSWSKVIGSKTFTNESADVYACVQMNFWSDTILSEKQNFMDFGLSSIKTKDELRSVFTSTNRIVGPTCGFNWPPPGNDIIKATADRVIGKKEKNYYNFKSEFETRREKMVDQCFGSKNNPMAFR